MARSRTEPSLSVTSSVSSKAVRHHLLSCPVSIRWPQQVLVADAPTTATRAFDAERSGSVEFAVKHPARQGRSLVECRLCAAVTRQVTVWTNPALDDAVSCCRHQGGHALR
jgi:hypothetical protein